MILLINLLKDLPQFDHQELHTFIKSHKKMDRRVFFEKG